MWIVKGVKPIKKALIEGNEYIVFIEIELEEEIFNTIISKKKVDKRFCKVNKNGNIIIRFNGEKIKSNINDIPS